MVNSAQLFTQLRIKNRVACVLDVLVKVIESNILHLNLVGIRTETAEEVNYLALLVDSSTIWNSDVLDSDVAAIFSLLKHCELKATFLEVVVGAELPRKDSVGIILSVCAVHVNCAKKGHFFGFVGVICLVLGAHSRAAAYRTKNENIEASKRSHYLYYHCQGKEQIYYRTLTHSSGKVLTLT